MPRLALFLVITLLAIPALASPKVGKPAPTLSATLLNDEHYTLPQSQGHVVLVTFWATWCPPCLHEMPELERLYQRYHTEGLDILGISVDDADDLNKVHAYTQSLHYPIAQLTQVKANGYGRIWAVPLLFVIDRNGVLRKDGWAGLVEKDYPELELMIQNLLAEKTPE